MAVYRIKQFFNAITAKITEEDLSFINKYLDRSEIELFDKLPIYDRKHSINVAKDIIKEIHKETFEKLNKEMHYETLIKAALLHDIGKSYKKLNPIDKSILVLLNKITKGKLKRYNNFKKVHVYYNHGEEGYKLLKNKNYSNIFLKVIRDHHKKDINCDYTKIIKKYDDRN